MSIENITFNNAIMQCRESGRVDSADAEAYARAVAQYAAQSIVPIVVLMDARDAEFITPEASSIFVKANDIPNVLAFIIVTDDIMITQVARILSLRNPHHTTHTFDDWNEAITFAHRAHSDFTARL